MWQTNYLSYNWRKKEFIGGRILLLLFMLDYILMLSKALMVFHIFWDIFFIQNGIQMTSLDIFES